MSKPSPVGSFCLKVGYDGKEPFLICNRKMDVMPSEAEQLQEAKKQSSVFLEQFYTSCMPDGMQRPKITGIKLGYVTMISDDHEWRRFE
jgi:hypothetical protein